MEGKRDIASEIIVTFRLKAKNRAETLERIGSLLDDLRALPATVLYAWVADSAEDEVPYGLAVIRPDAPSVTLPKLHGELGHQFGGLLRFEPNDVIALDEYDDPQLRWQWALETLGASEPWTAKPSGTKIIVAIVDSGLRRPNGDPPEDIGQVETLPVCQPQPIPWPISYPGLFLDGVDQDGHGTFLAGTIAAVPGNAKGIASAIPSSWNVSLMPVKFFGPASPPNIADAAIAIRWAANKGAKVINASWHVTVTDGNKSVLADAIKDANDKGCLVVAAAGNDGTDNAVYPTYPANYGNPSSHPGLKVLTVAATAPDDTKASFSNYSAKLVDIAAPGQRIITTGTYRRDPARYPSYSGTSAAAAFVSSGAALMLALNPGWTADEVLDQLKASADHVPALDPVCKGGRRLNLRAAVTGPLHVTSPAAGDTLHAGTFTFVRWTSDYDNPNFNKVKIELSLDDGATYPIARIIDASAPNTGSYHWKPLAADKTDTARIRITPLNGNFPAVSGSFSIK